VTKNGQNAPLGAGSTLTKTMSSTVASSNFEDDFDDEWSDEDEEVAVGIFCKYFFKNWGLKYKR